MNARDQIGFTMGCAFGFNLDSDEVDIMLQKYGLTIKDNTLLECQEALREHVGEERWKNGIKIIRSRTRESKSEFN